MTAPAPSTTGHPPPASRALPGSPAAQPGATPAADRRTPTPDQSANAGPVRLAPGRWRVEAMDTVFSIAAPGLAGRGDADALVAAIAADWAATEAALSVFRPDSEISRWRRHEIGDDRLSAGTREVLAACDRLERLTDGLFSSRRDGSADPTGYVKGWALARAGAAFDQAEVASYCINGGGDVIARGHGFHRVPWRIGIAHPYRPGELSTIVTPIPGEARPVAVATSGTGERGRHIVNPVTGWRPQRSSVTVVGHDIALVDAIATAALAAGCDGPGASAALVRRVGLEAFGFGEDGRPWWSPGMVRYALLPQAPTSAPAAAQP